MKPITIDQTQRDEIVAEWKQALDALLRQVTSWVRHEPDWQVEQQPYEITEEALGAYHVDKLLIHTPQGTLHLEPVARMVFGGTGTVELYAWPTLYRVRLLRNGTTGDWKVLTDSGIILRQEWNAENLLQLARDLLAAE